MGSGKPEELQPVSDQEIAQVCASFYELPEEYQRFDSDLLELAETWKQKQLQVMTASGILAKVDESSMERGKLIYLNMMMMQRQLMIDGYFIETENGKKEHPAGPAFRAYSNQLEKWEGQHAAYPMARHNKNMNLEKTGGRASHGNRKNKALDLISGN